MAGATLALHDGAPLTRAQRVRVGGAAALCLAVVALTPRDHVPMLAGADVPVAAATAVLARASGLDVEREGPVLRHPTGFSMEIYWRCTGLLPAAFVAALVVATPSSGRRKLLGVLAGGGFVLLLNLVRLGSLFAIGAWSVSRFGLAHGLWELVIGLSVPLTWLAWLRLTRRPGRLEG